MTERRRRDPLVIGMAVICLCCLVVAIVVSYAALSNSRELRLIREGREDAVAAFCQVDRVIIQQGKDLLSASYLLPGDRPRPDGSVFRGPVTRFLERIGFPPIQQRKRAAQAAARNYEDRIADAVRGAAGVRAGPGGGLNCAALQRKATRAG